MKADTKKAAVPAAKKQRREGPNIVLTTAFMLLAGFIIGGLVMLAGGFNPIEAYKAMFSGVFGSPKGIFTAIIKATPIIGTGLSVAFAQKCGLFNIGAEGQFIIGTVTAGLIGYFAPLPPGIHPLVCIIGAGLAGGLLGMFVGFLKSKFGISEVISGIMLNWIMLYTRNAVAVMPGYEKSSNVSFPVRESAQMVALKNWQGSEAGQEALANSPVLRDFFKADPNWGILVVLALAVVVWFIFKKTSLGYRVQAVGANRYAAEYAGINVDRHFLVTLFIAGALSGIAGGLQILTVPHHTLSVLAGQEGYGFNGIAVALMGNNSPIGCVLAGLLFAVLTYGGTRIQASIKVPSETINIMIGVIVLFAGIPSLLAIIQKKFRKKASSPSSDASPPPPVSTAEESGPSSALDAELDNTYSNVGRQGGELK